MQWMNEVSRFTRKNSPEILAGLAAAGVIATAYLAHKASVKTGQRQLLQEQEGKVTTWQEQVRADWQLYIPPALAGIGTIACIIGSSRIGHRRNAALVAGMAFADRAFSEYREEVKELLGERKELGVREKIAQKRIDANPASGTVIVMGKGETVCYDPYTDRYFRSDPEVIRRAVNEVNHAVIHDTYASQNSFYSLIGLGDCIAGDEMGWNLDHLLEIDFTSHLDADETPVLAINYIYLPVPKYANLH